MYSYKLSGVCSKEVNFDVEDNKLKNVTFIGGCPGNLLGLAKLLEGMELEDAAQRLKGIGCRDKSTSCPDQFSQAIEDLISKK